MQSPQVLLPTSGSPVLFVAEFVGEGAPFTWSSQAAAPSSDLGLVACGTDAWRWLSWQCLSSCWGLHAFILGKPLMNWGVGACAHCRREGSRSVTVTRVSSQSRPARSPPPSSPLRTTGISTVASACPVGDTEVALKPNL